MFPHVQPCYSEFIQPTPTNGREELLEMSPRVRLLRTLVASTSKALDPFFLERSHG